MGKQGWDKLVPFTSRGLVHYPDHFSRYVDGKEEEIQWFPQEQTRMHASLRFVRIASGRSAVNAIFKDTNGKEYPVFLRDFEDLIPKMACGLVTGWWIGVKRGQNFGLAPVDSSGR
jgi:hypothetical protein